MFNTHYSNFVSKDGSLMAAWCGELVDGRYALLSHQVWLASPWASTGVGSSDLFLGWLGKGPWMTWGCMVGRVVGTSHGFKSK